jgi:hypothetical protein
MYEVEEGVLAQLLRHLRLILLQKLRNPPFLLLGQGRQGCFQPMKVGRGQLSIITQHLE